MKRSRLLPLAIAAVLGIAACGSDDAGVALPEPGVQEQDAPSATSDEPGDVGGSGSDPEPGGEPAGDAAMVEIGSANVGGSVVDAKPHPIDRIDVAESFPEQLGVVFTAGDPNCTAADAAASITGDVVLVELSVGITEDALTRSCMAGEFEQTIMIALAEPLAGREVVGAVPPDTDGSADSRAPLPGDGSVEAMAEAIVGLDVDTAEQQVTDAGFAFRVIEVDGQPQAIEEDQRDDRINARLEGGSVIAVEVF